MDHVDFLTDNYGGFWNLKISSHTEPHSILPVFELQKQFNLVIKPLILTNRLYVDILGA
jgi:hypothetical protein